MSLTDEPLLAMDTDSDDDDDDDEQLNYVPLKEQGEGTTGQQSMKHFQPTAKMFNK